MRFHAYEGRKEEVGGADAFWLACFHCVTVGDLLPPDSPVSEDDLLGLTETP